MNAHHQTPWTTDNDAEDDDDLLDISTWATPHNRYEMPSQAYVRAYVDYFYGRRGSIAEFDGEYYEYRAWSWEGTISCYKCTIHQMWGFDIQIEQRPVGGFKIYPGLPD